MAAWRRKALELLPRLAPEIQDAGSTIYDVFRELEGVVREGLREGELAEVARAFEFAEWAYEQKDLNNAAAVVFYEDLFDGPAADVRDVAKWIPARIAADVMPLWERKLSADRLAEVRRALGLSSPK